MTSGSWSAGTLWRLLCSGSLANWRHHAQYALGVLAALAGTGAALIAVAGAGAATSGPPSGITGGQTLTSGSVLESSDGHYTAGFTNGVLSTKITGGRTLWSEGSSSSGGDAVLQSNGSLVIFDASGQVAWDSGTTGTGCPALDMQLDGNLVVYDPAAIWSDSTAQHGMQPGDDLEPGWSLYPHGSEYRLEMQTDGNLVIENDSAKAIWSSGTSGNPGAYATMQTDGNFVVYSTKHKALWSTKTSSNPGATLAFASTGDLDVESTAGKSLWSSGSTGKAGTGSAFSLAPVSASTTPCPSAPVAPTTTTVVQTVTTTQTETQTVVVPTTTVVTVAAPPPVPRKKRLDVRLTLGFKPSGDITFLTSIGVGRLPTGAELTATYNPDLRGHRARVRHAVRGRTLVALVRYLRDLRYRPGQTLNLNITRRGYENEFVTFTFRAGRLPTYRTRSTKR
jgi:hypothetical protein